MKPRAKAEGNAGQQSTYRAQNRISLYQALERIRQVARTRKKEQFTSLLHHVSIDLLRQAYFDLKRKAAPGVDGLTWSDYGVGLEGNLASLHDRVHQGTYRALPSRRRYIPKPDGRQRPLAIAALEDKIVERAVVAVLNAVYEEDFLGFSYGFRPKRNQHDALDALVVGITATKVNYILNADIQKFFDSVSQKWLGRFLEHRIKDPRILRLIQKWLKEVLLMSKTLLRRRNRPLRHSQVHHRAEAESRMFPMFPRFSEANTERVNSGLTREGKTNHLPENLGK